jgi:hypothetical protein
LPLGSISCEGRLLADRNLNDEAYNVAQHAAATLLDVEKWNQDSDIKDEVDDTKAWWPEAAPTL